MAVVKFTPRLTKHNHTHEGRVTNRTVAGKLEKQERKAKPLPRPLTVATVVVAVGSRPDKFFIHETFLCASADFFKNALKPEWKVRGDKTIKISDADCGAFGTYADWLYTGHVTINKDEVKSKKTAMQSSTEASNTTTSSATASTTDEDEWNNWVKCYDLGRFLQDTDFNDALIDFIIDKMAYDGEYMEGLPNIIYPLTTKSSPHRKLVVDVATKVWLPSSFTKISTAKFTTDFLADLCTAMSITFRTGGTKELAPHVVFKDRDTCMYHEHTCTNAPCYKDKRDL